MTSISTAGPSSMFGATAEGQHSSKTNPIDLTSDDDDGEEHDSYDSPRASKRMRTSVSPSVFVSHNDPSKGKAVMAHPSYPPRNTSASLEPSIFSHPSMSAPGPYLPAFAGPSHSSAFFPTRHASPAARTTQLPMTQHPQSIHQAHSPRHAPSPQVIDLTRSPSPTPAMGLSQPPLPPDLAPKTPVCIGQLNATALVMYPVPYIMPVKPGAEEWVPVRLQYEQTPHKPGAADTIHIKTPGGKLPNGELIPSEAFALIEQKVATSLGPMLGKGLIRLDAMVRKAEPGIPILPIQMVVYTPKGNIPVVGSYLQQCGHLLDHPTPPCDVKRLNNFHYYNPHEPPPGGHNRIILAQDRSVYAPNNSCDKWAPPNMNGKSVEVQRSEQVDELFKNMKDGKELAETEPAPEIAATLYPHQKKALTFLLEREHEQTDHDGKYPSLWQERVHPITRSVSWVNLVTQKEVFERPKESKGAILADDMGLGKTITCVSLIAATLAGARRFSATPLEPAPRAPGNLLLNNPDAEQFSGKVWGMPESGSSTKSKAKAQRAQERMEAEFARATRIKIKSRATLIICPLSTVANWEDQFREHWAGVVDVVGGAGVALKSGSSAVVKSSESMPSLRIYVYHGNARRPDPTFLADFDAVITTFATLASEFSKQNRSVTATDGDEDEEGGSSDGYQEYDEYGNLVTKAKPKKIGNKRKKTSSSSVSGEVSSALQSVHWFRVVLDEAHCIKETATVGSRACCDLIADRRLCLTGTPVQNKLDDVFALIKFLRLEPLDDKAMWTEFIGTPVKFGQSLGVARLQTIMRTITLRRTKESKTPDGKRILRLPPRRDELRLLKFDEQEQNIYDQFFKESKAEFNEMSGKGEVMKNYVGILQKILRLRQICCHYELVEGKQGGDPLASYEDTVAAIANEGFTLPRAATIFSLMRDSATTQCVECGGELCTASEPTEEDVEAEASKKGRKPKAGSSRSQTRANSPSGAPRPILTKCQHLFCLSCYRNSICPNWPQVSAEIYRSCAVCQTALGVADAIELKPDCTDDCYIKKKPGKRERRQRGLALPNFHPSTKIKALLGDLIQFSKINPHSTNYDPNSIEVEMVDNAGNIITEGPTKTVVFSQWTTMLDKIEDALEVAGIRYERLDGTMKRDERTRSMEALKVDPACEVLLVSLKAGGVGLNLTAAQRVYLMDPYWNPAVENQAVDRIHRLGQTRPVTTVKLIIENSIEARLLAVQKKKLALANMTLSTNLTKGELLARRMEELTELFN